MDGHTREGEVRVCKSPSLKRTWVSSGAYHAAPEQQEGPAEVSIPREVNLRPPSKTFLSSLTTASPSCPSLSLWEWKEHFLETCCRRPPSMLQQLFCLSPFLSLECQRWSQLVATLRLWEKGNMVQNYTTTNTMSHCGYGESGRCSIRFLWLHKISRINSNREQ